jgi:hypothetical protein
MRDPDEQPRRLGLYVVSPDAVLRLGRGCFEVITNPVPSDARIVRSYYDGTGDLFVMVLEHESFKEVLPGAVVPWIELPQLRSVTERDIRRYIQDESLTAWVRAGEGESLGIGNPNRD